MPHENISTTNEIIKNSITTLEPPEIDLNLVPSNIDDNIYSVLPIDPNLEKAKELSLGFSFPELEEIFKYVSGREPRPDCMDKK